MTKLFITDLLLKEKRVIIRVDFNVPLDTDGNVADDRRIQEALPTIQYVLKSGGAVILISHMGRPKSKKELQFSLGICAKRLSELIEAPVLFISDCIGKEVEKKVKNLKWGEVLLLENLRYYSAEENPDSDPDFAKKLASFGDVYVNDAFSVAHRAHASTTVIDQYFPKKAAMGFLMRKEISFLQPLVMNPPRPFFVLMGGAKVSTKIKVLKALVKKADRLFVGGRLSFVFFKIQGVETGEVIFSETELEEARELLQACEKSKKPLSLPLDVVIGDRFSNEAIFKTVPTYRGIPKGWFGMDIGSATIRAWKADFQCATTFFWNGPLGVFEFSPFDKGTNEVAKILSSLKGVVFAGGGESLLAIHRLGLESKFSYLSTGGGALLEYLAYGQLPGIEALTSVYTEIS